MRKMRAEASELKVALAKTMANFAQNKAVPSFRKRSRKYVKAGTWKTLL